MSISNIMRAGTGEKLQYLVHEYNDNTILFVLRYPGKVDAGALCAAVRAVAESVEILHASFRSDSSTAYWEVNADLEEGDFFRLVETEGDPVDEAMGWAVRPVAAEGKAQLRCTLVYGDTGSAVVVAISRLCVDGSDGKYLLEKLAQAYGMVLETGCAAALSVKDGNRATEQIYEELDRRDMLGLLRNPMSRIKSAFPYPTREAGQPRMARRVIPADTMAAARRRAKDQGATVNDVLLAACYHAYAAMPGVESTAPMSILSMMDLRRHCKNGESAGLCNMTGSLPTQMPNGLGQSFSDTLGEVAAQTRAVKEDPLAGLEGMPLLHGAVKTLPMGLLLRVAGRLYGGFSIGLTNLGSLSGQALALGGSCPTEGYFGGPLKKKPAMQISACSLDGACALCAAGQYTQQDEGLLLTMMEGMADEIAAYAAGK